MERPLGHKLPSENPIFTGLKFGNIVLGLFTPVMAKHSKSFSLIELPAHKILHPHTALSILG
jgi:hypothetical protein